MRTGPRSHPPIVESRASVAAGVGPGVGVPSRILVIECGDGGRGASLESARADRMHPLT